MDNCPLYGQFSIVFCREIIKIRFTQSCGQIQSQINLSGQLFFSWTLVVVVVVLVVLVVVVVSMMVVAWLVVSIV